MMAGQARILIVDDEPIKRLVLEDELAAAGYSVVTASNPLDAAKELAKSSFEVVVTDIRMPGGDGLSFLREIKKQKPTQAAIVMTAYGSVETAIEAMKIGAFDYLQKPFSTEELILKLDKLLQYERLASENEALRHELALPRIEGKIVGQSKPMLEVLQRIHAVAGTETSVLIEGESGTGKELIARTLHESSFRASGPFVAIACAALPKDLVESELFGHESGSFTGATKRRIGRFELAHGGTLFLDDVDDIPLDIQVKLVRVLQERVLERVGGERPIPVNIRLIAATKRPLQAMVVAGSFREDLFYRLNVVPLKIPPLRERVEDIPLLLEHFLDKLSVKNNRGRLAFSPEAVARLQRQSWPGNVRELEHKVEMIVALAKGAQVEADEIPELDAPKESGDLISLKMSGIEHVDIASVLEDLETRLIRWALERAEGNLAKAAEMLGIPRSTLQYKINRRSYTSDAPSSQG
jgi:DNA-binding NtrC family response regulator